MSLTNADIEAWTLDVYYDRRANANLPTLTAKLAREVLELRRWKAEATTVIEQWEAAWEAAGCPGALGDLKSAAMSKWVQELRHLRDNVLPDLRQELDVANAYLADCRKLIADLRALHKDRRHQFGWVRCAECQHTYPCPTIRLIEGAGV